MTLTPASDPARIDDLRMARVHLRMGQLALARAELEDLYRRDALDVVGLAVLAEARWRTGEGPAAARAAAAHLDAGGSDDVALCIAAEAMAAEGRPADARALMDRLPASDAATLDALFAGMPRRAFWPAGPVDRSDIDELRRETDARAQAGRRGGMRPAAPASGTDDESSTQIYQQPAGASAASGQAGSPLGAPPIDRRAIPGPREVLEATAAGAFGASGRPSVHGVAPTGREAHPGERRVKGHMDPAAELASARDELSSKPERAILRLSLVLRHDPTYAPAVLDILHLRREPSAALVRGDAQRLLGRHMEAEAAFDAAAESLEVS
ncbi:MAG TPA: hypothetical protein VL749_12475 [Patescibacteria group bacterium]|nr:hypothetical protein [Patescibacteria group bacterium]